MTESRSISVALSAIVNGSVATVVCRILPSEGCGASGMRSPKRSWDKDMRKTEEEVRRTLSGVVVWCEEKPV